MPTAMRISEQPAQYYDPGLGHEVVKIKPGEYFATTRHYVIATVLGSCVAACVRDTVRGGAGMNHFMLPRQESAAADAQGPAALRYGVYAMESLINEFVKRGSHRSHLEVKVFGGSSVMTFTNGDIGRQNAEFVKEYLQTEGIPTAAVDLGGELPRRVLYFVETGEVWVKYLKRLKNDTIFDRETEYARALETVAGAAVVDLF